MAQAALKSEGETSLRVRYEVVYRTTRATYLAPWFLPREYRKRPKLAVSRSVLFENWGMAVQEAMSRLATGDEVIGIDTVHLVEVERTPVKVVIGEEVNDEPQRDSS